MTEKDGASVSRNFDSCVLNDRCHLVYGMVDDWKKSFQHYYKRPVFNFSTRLSVRPTIFPWGQFWPSDVVIACICLCVCVCQSQAFCAITCLLFEIKSPNLNQKCNTRWLRSLLFWCWLTLTFKFKFNLKIKIYTILSLSAWSLATSWSKDF